MTVTKNFLTSVADVLAFDESDNILFSSKTLLDSSIDVKLASTDIRGGRGNQLLYKYFNSNEMTISLTDVQFNLGLLSTTVNADIVTGNNVYTSETITLGAGGGGTILGTPLAIQGTALYGWVNQLDGTIEKVTFTTKTFATSTGTSGDVVCVNYLSADAASRSMTIPANVLPKVVRLVMTAQLNTADDSSNQIGHVEFLVYKAQLSGSFTISMKSDGYSTTPLTATALAYQDVESAACTTTPVYCRITEVLDDATWYQNIVALAIGGGDFALTHPDTETLVVYAIPSNGDAPFIPPYADLDFSSGTVGTATIGAHTGIVTTVGNGTTLLTVVIHSKNTVEASCTVTVSGA
jgi:hypothetical protein